MAELKEIGEHGMIEENGSIVDFQALDINVLIVASANIEVRDWAAYAGAVPGHDHSREYREPLARGSKIPQKVAEFLFPWFKERFNWRR